MIEKMDHVRRREMAKLDYEAKRTIKGHRSVFMRNEENLDAKGLSSTFTSTRRRRRST
jgi:hypothetical protein